MLTFESSSIKPLLSWGSVFIYSEADLTSFPSVIVLPSEKSASSKALSFGVSKLGAAEDFSISIYGTGSFSGSSGMFSSSFSIYFGT